MSGSLLKHLTSAASSALTAFVAATKRCGVEVHADPPSSERDLLDSATVANVRRQFDVMEARLAPKPTQAAHLAGEIERLSTELARLNLEVQASRSPSAPRTAPGEAVAAAAAERAALASMASAAAAAAEGVHLGRGEGLELFDRVREHPRRSSALPSDSSLASSLYRSPAREHHPLFPPDSPHSC